MSHVDNLKKLLDPNTNLSSIDWSDPKNVEWLANARKELDKMFNIIDALSEYGPGIDIWADDDAV
jgi:hypothetical protein